MRFGLVRHLKRQLTAAVLRKVRRLCRGDDVSTAAAVLLRFKRLLDSEPAYLFAYARMQSHFDNPYDAIPTAELALSRLGCGQGWQIHSFLVAQFLTINDVDQAEQHATHLSTKFPQSTAALIAQGVVARFRLDYSRAEHCFQNALNGSTTSEKSAQLMRLLARTREDAGNTTGAAASYRAALTHFPDDMRAFYRLSLLRDEICVDDPLTDEVRHRLNTRTLGRDAACSGWFGLGLLLDRAGEYDAAFGAFIRANTIRNVKLDRDRIESVYKSRVSHFPAPVETASQGDGKGRRIIFVVGMPRSGTTLVEQILSAHPDVIGLGERDNLSRLTSTMHELIGLSQTYPDCIHGLTDGDIRKLSELLVANMSSGVGVAHNLVTKQPTDFWEIGLIRLLLPSSPIVHCLRHPLDVCLSCFMQNFLRVDFSTTLDDLGYYYRYYWRMMAHWSHYSDITSVYYEALVADPRETISRLLKDVGLAPSEECFTFDRHSRRIDTPSIWQVQQPVYTSSSGRWLSYRSHLGPLIEQIGDLVDSYPNTFETRSAKERLD